MNTPIFIITSITLLVILGAFYLELRRQIKPRIKVYFSDGSTQASYEAKEEANVSIHFKNAGRRCFPKPVASNVKLSVDTPTSFMLKELKWGGQSETKVRKALPGGVFGGMHYLRLPATISLQLFHGEEEAVQVLMQMPEETGKWTIKVAILSDEGDLGVHELEIKVT